VITAEPVDAQVPQGVSEVLAESGPDINRQAPKEIWWVRTSIGRIPMLHPDSRFLVMWLLIGFTFIIFEAFSIPLSLAFSIKAAGGYFWFVSVINSYFLVDIPINFFSGYVDGNGSLTMKPSKTARRYLASGFVPDVISALPWEWIDLGDSGPSGTAQFTRGIRFIRAFRLLRLTRLFRLMRTNAMSEKIEIFVEANQIFQFLTGLARILFLLFGITHWAACAWYSMGCRNVGDDDTTWIDRYLMPRWQEDDKLERYVYSVYFTLTTMTTVGYGDMSAQNIEETCFVLVLLLVASVVFAGLMGVLTDLISTLNNASNVRNDRKAQLSRYMRWRAVPHDLFLNIRQHILFLWDENEGFETYEEDIKAQLSPALKTELCFHIYGRLLNSCPFLSWLQGYEPCMKQLATMVQSFFLSKGDLLFRVGQPNEQIYLLLHGSVWLTRNESLFPDVGSLSKGAIINEGPEGFMIPRHREAGIVDVGKMLVDKTVQKTKMRKSASNCIRDEVVTEWGVRKPYCGLETSGNPIFDSMPLRQATAVLKRSDLRQKKAARTIQRRWRRRKASLDFPSESPYKETKRKATMLQSKTVSSPAYFGESCLWSPVEKWKEEEPPLYTYTARCETRSELVYLPREAMQELFALFTPWLGERFEVFRQAVIASLSTYVDVGKKNIDKVNIEGNWVDLGPMDTTAPQDDQAMDAMHCKTLLRAAQPTRTQMTILRSAAGQNLPAMPRVNTMTLLSDSPATPATRPPVRMSSGLESRRSVPPLGPPGC